MDTVDISEFLGTEVMCTVMYSIDVDVPLN